MVNTQMSLVRVLLGVRHLLFFFLCFLPLSPSRIFPHMCLYARLHPRRFDKLQLHVSATVNGCETTCLPPTLRRHSPPSPKFNIQVPKLQPQLVNSLLERLLEFSVDDQDDSVQSNLDDDETPDLSSMPRLILSQLRWLERIVQPIELVSQLIRNTLCTS